MNRLVSLVAFCAVLLGAHEALGRTIHVPSAEYLTIQQAVDAAAPGDTVLVGPGEYVGPGNRNIRFGGKDIVLRSSHGAAATVIRVGGNSQENARGFVFDGGESNVAVLEGLTISEGYASLGEAPYNGGGGVLCVNSTPTIRDCVFVDNDARLSRGGGLLSWQASADQVTIVSSCVFVANGGRGLRVDGGQGKITNTEFWENRPDGALMISGAAVQIRDCRFYGNQTTLGSGSAIRGFAGAVLEITACEVVGNGLPAGSQGGGGIALAGGSEARIEDCVIAGNACGSAGGGGVFLYEASATLRGCTIAGNVAATGFQYGGGGVAATFSSSINVERCILWGNCGLGPGWELVVAYGSQGQIACCDIGTGGIYALDGSLIDGGHNFTSDPQFCDPRSCTEAPTPDGFYALRDTSPCLPEASPCGMLVGALGPLCSASSLPERHALPAPQAIAWTTLHPNPTPGGVTLGLEAHRETSYSLDLVDVAGRRLGRLRSGRLTLGRNEIHVSRKDISSLTSTSGVFYLLLQTPSERIERRFVVIAQQ